ncbi:hypothetical protein GRF29_44g2072253 [Pseudopithomyces chartarum]|uniref:NmrA-like domain-containing protein n=1 Tax=Pseudopithomyces chartarum TaxID=1892770 RepID=A0AAN6M139_9PLEO|nr:hypothetical protein GRF29_44g2072253 [Pseudopithomyces chartarum]
MANKKVLAVFGSTGHQVRLSFTNLAFHLLRLLKGGAVISHFLGLDSSPYRVRALTRNPSSNAARKLADSGVEVVRADLDDLESLTNALKDAHAVFLVTDFFSCIDAGAQREMAQAKRALKVLSESTSLEHLLHSSLPGVRRVSKGKYNAVIHFDGKAEVVDWLRDTHAELWGKTTILWVGTYMQIWEQFKDVFAPKKTITEDGEEVWKQRMVFYPESKLPLVDVRDVGKVVQAILTSGGEYKGGKTVSLVAPNAVSMKDQLDIWGAQVGKQTVFEHISEEESLQSIESLGFPEFLTKALWEVGLAYRDCEGKLLHQEGVVQASEVSPEDL